MLTIVNIPHWNSWTIRQTLSKIDTNVTRPLTCCPAMEESEQSPDPPALWADEEHIVHVSLVELRLVELKLFLQLPER